DDAADAAATARLRGERAGALECAAGALPAARGAGEHPDREPVDRGAALPPAAPPGARPDRAAARGDDAEGAVAAETGVVDARRPRLGALRARARGARGRPRARAPARPLQRQGLL